jgi:hypothetical protein
MKPKPSIHEAAEVLYRSIPAPRGSVNTMVSSQGNVRCIKVLVDPTYRLLISVPSTFMGYRVIVEDRQPSVAHQ